MNIGFVCSSGGHLAQLHALQAWWGQHDRFWVTFDLPDSAELLADERVHHGAWPTTRNLPNLVRNARQARQVMWKEQPDVLVSNGAGIALPFFAMARLMGVPTVFIEVYDRIDSPSLTGRLLAPLADRVVLQWPEQQRHYPSGVVLGRVW